MLFVCSVAWLFLLGCQYQRKWLTGKTRLRNDLYCVDEDVKPYSLAHSVQCTVCCLFLVFVRLTISGIYIPETRTAVPKELRGLGMRIEDDVLVTSSGPHNLCSQCPKHPDEIESLMNSRTSWLKSVLCSLNVLRVRLHFRRWIF